jgi:hypothetical protein
MNPAETTAAREPLHLTLAEMERIAAAAATGQIEKQVLNHRDPRRLVVRVPTTAGKTAILKLWDRSGAKGRLRAFLRNDSLSYEWSALARLHRCGAAVPRPIGQCRLSWRETRFTHALFLEDLGKCQMAGYYIRDLMLAGEEKKLLETEDEAIGLVCSMLRAGLVDTDRSIYNIVLAQDGKLYLLDFELARRIRLQALSAASCARMLGRLIVTYTFAVQPQSHRAGAFALRLAERVRPPPRVLHLTRKYVEASLEEQHRSAGVRTESFLPW